MFFQVEYHKRKYQNDRLHCYFNNKIYLQAATQFS